MIKEVILIIWTIAPISNSATTDSYIQVVPGFKAMELCEVALERIKKEDPRSFKGVCAVVDDTKNRWRTE